MSLDLEKMEKQLDEALKKETKESLLKWLNKQRNRIERQPKAVGVEQRVSAENGEEDESFEIFDKLLNDCTRGKLYSGEYYYLTSTNRILRIAKKYLSRVELRKLEERYASRFSG